MRGISSYCTMGGTWGSAFSAGRGNVMLDVGSLGRWVCVRLLAKWVIYCMRSFSLANYNQLNNHIINEIQHDVAHWPPAVRSRVVPVNIMYSTNITSGRIGP